MSKESFLNELMGRMSLEEKAGQLNMLTGTMDATGMKNSGDLEEKVRAGLCGAVLNVYTPAATRELQELALKSPLRIPLLFSYDVIHGHRTIFPIPLGLSCSWNPDLMERCARMAAAEAAADGLHWVFSPMVDISQDPRWGRVAEGAGEDPWLGSIIAEAMVRGYQGDDPGNPAAVLACVKHFALYGAPQGGRDYNTVDMSRRAMEETYFPPYRAAVDAGARTVMTAFNEIDGIPASGNHWLLTDLLRDEWGFEGLVVTDYTSVTEMKNHGTAATDADAARQSLDAGVDMDMVSEAFLTNIPALVRSGVVRQYRLDTAVRRVLEMKWDLGLFLDAFARCDEERAVAIHGCETHRKLAREAARESMVLLKNDSQLMPLGKQGTIAVIGPLADSRRDMLGCWAAAGDETGTVSPLEGIRAAVADRAKVTHAAGCEILKENPQSLEEAVRVAGDADVVILVLGESWQMNGEAACRTDIRLPKSQRKLADAIFNTGSPCVLVTMSGRPLDLSTEDGKFPSILHAWALGSEGGRAMADVLFGTTAPIGKLTMGFPRNVGQLPMTYRAKPTGRPFKEEDPYTTRYLDSCNEPLYPFGHGLTYGKFRFGAPKTDRAEMTAGQTLTVFTEITNQCQHPATETLQLYIRDLVASISRPVKELRGYRRVTLDAGESRVVAFEITDEHLGFPGSDFHPVVEPGEFEVMTGPDSTNLRTTRFMRL